VRGDVTTWQSRPGKGAAPVDIVDSYADRSDAEHNGATDAEFAAVAAELLAGGDDAETRERKWRARFGIPGGFAVLVEDYDDGGDDDDEPQEPDPRMVSRQVWMRAIRGQITPATPGVGPRRATTIVAVAFFLASWANGDDGRRCRPGQAKLCAASGLSERAVRNAVQWLDHAGWITRTARRDRRAGLSDEFRLSVPADVAAELSRARGPERSEGR
jgi:hypothetical protein